MHRLAPERASQILEAMNDVRVLVVGDLMLDEYIAGVVDRISPEAPVPVVRVERERWAVGGAANVAANVTALGAGCDVVGVVGHDAGGRRLTEALRQVGVRVEGVVVADDRPTTVKTRVLARSQQVVRFDRETDADVEGALAQSLVDSVVERAGDCDVILMEDYNKGVLTPQVITSVLAAAKTHGVATVVDPKRLRFFGYAGATVFKPNSKELADALGEHLSPDDPEWMDATRRRLQCETLLLTLGERGMALSTAEGRFFRVPAVARSVYDVSGAGDTVVAVTAVALAAGADEIEAAILANHAAALEVQKAGVATVSPREILDQTLSFYQMDDT